MLWLGSKEHLQPGSSAFSPRHTFLIARLVTGAEAEGGRSAPSLASQPAARNHQAPRGNKTRHRPATNSHPPASSLAPPTDDGTSGGKKIGQSSPALTPLAPFWKDPPPFFFFQMYPKCSALLFFFLSFFFKPNRDVSPTAPNIDRSVKDLQRCTASLTRYRMVVKEEMDSSIKRMKLTFAELQSWCVSAQHKSEWKSWFVLQWSKLVGGLVAKPRVPAHRCNLWTSDWLNCIVSLLSFFFYLKKNRGICSVFAGFFVCLFFDKCGLYL